MLVAYDAKVTRVDLAKPTAQVAAGTPVTDADGTRQASVLFRAGTKAEMVMPDGTVRPLESLDVRATEFTAGASGPAAMPGSLPPSSAYTYAAELSVDQAVAAGATEVRFDKPVVNYVDNFLGFPVGGIVPTGYYDREAGEWKAAPNGRVIKLAGRRRRQGAGRHRRRRPHRRRPRHRRRRAHAAGRDAPRGRRAVARRDGRTSRRGTTTGPTRPIPTPSRRRRRSRAPTSRPTASRANARRRARSSAARARRWPRSSRSPARRSSCATTRAARAVAPTARSRSR